MNKGQFRKGHKGYWLGKTMPIETKIKMGEAHKGHPNYLPNDFIPWNKGMKTSPEVIKKLRISHLGQKAWNNKNRTPDELRVLHREYRLKNKLMFKAHDHKKRLLRRDLTLKTVQMVYEDNIKQHGTLTCYLCLKAIGF